MQPSMEKLGESRCVVPDQAKNSCIDLRVQGEPDQATDDEERKRSQKKDKLMGDFFPKDDDKEYQDISQIAENIVEEQGSLEAHDILMITNTVQCKSCYQLRNFRNTSCECGLIFHEARKEVKKQVLKNVINCFSVPRTTAFVFKTGKPRGKQLLAAKAPKLYHKAREHNKNAMKKLIENILERYQQDTKGIGIIISDKVSPKSKSGTVFQRDQKENTSLPQQQVNIGPIRTS